MAKRREKKTTEERKANASQERRIELVPLATLQAATRNPKAHSSEIATSVGRFGYVEPIVLDERTGRIVAGHGRREAMLRLRDAGSPPPSGVEVRDGEWFVPVLRGWSSQSDAEAEAYLVASNKLTEVGGWNEDGLAAMLRDLESADALEGVGFSTAEIDRLCSVEEVADAEKPEPESDPADEVEEPTAIWVKDGEIWRLGDHVAICADSLAPETMAAALELLGAKSADLVVTDPPYAIYGSSTGIGADDRMVRPFFEKVFRAIHANLKLFGHAYSFTDWRSWAALWESSRRSGITAKNKLIWDKGGAGLGSNYANTYEEIYFGAKLPKAMKGTEAGQRVVHRSNVLRYHRPAGAERLHNAAKPVELLKELVVNSSDPGEIVIDFFCGSGSTLIACEATGRRCITADLEPKWVQCVIGRWERLTGKKAECVAVLGSKVEAPAAAGEEGAAE